MGLGKLHRLGGWLGRKGRFPLLLLIALHLVPIWAFRYFPSQDGPNHLYSANILRLYHRPEGALYSQYYAINPRPDPNWATHLLLAGLMRLASPRVAEKLLLSGYILLLPLAVRFCLRRIRPGAWPWALAILPFSYNWMLQMGFYNFSYSLVMFFIVLGYGLRRRKWHGRLAHDFALRLGARQAGVLALLALALYFCHLVSLVMALIGLLTFGVADMLAWRRRGRPGLAFRRLGLTLLAFLPALALAALFVGRGGSAGGQTPPGRLFEFGWWKFKQFAMLYDPLVTFWEKELLFSGALGLLMLAGALGLAVFKTCKGRWGRRDALLGVALVWFVVYFFAPVGLSGGWFLSQRLSLYPFLGLILWFGAQPTARAARLGMQTLAIGLALTLLSLNMAKYRQLNDYLAEYASGAAALKPGSTLLPLCLSPAGLDRDGASLSLSTQPFLHASGYLALERGCVDLSDYEGITDYFPLRFRPEANPRPDFTFEPAAALTRVDLQRYTLRTGRAVDYVLVWDDARRLLMHPSMAALRAQLRAGFDLVYVSPPEGLLRIYRRKGA